MVERAPWRLAIRTESSDPYVKMGLMHSVDELLAFGLETRVTLPLKRFGWLYVEDLLGTSPWHMTIASGPAMGIWEGPGKPHKFKYKTYETYRYRPCWKEIPRISGTAVQNLLQALGKWKEYNRNQEGKPVV